MAILPLRTPAPLRTFHCAILLVCWLAPIHAIAADPPTDLLETVAARTRSIATLHADFRQERTLAILERPLVSSGYLCVRRDPEDPANGSHVLWAYTAPLASGFAWDAGKTRRWGSDGQPVATDSAHAAAMEAIAHQVLDWIAIDPAAVRQRYAAATVSTTLGPGIRLKPRQPNGFPFAALTATFASTLDRLTSLTFDEPSGDTTTLRFENVDINLPLPAGCSR